MKIRVMIVEDEPIIRMGISQVMPWDDMGCEVVTLAENGEDGIRKAGEFHPQMIISDIRMPKMSGLDMIEELSKSNKKIHYILLTGYKEFEYAQRAIAYSGGNFYFEQEINTDLARYCSACELK